jgi:glycosyltransferase involved in cell wall biosynthesis
MYGWEEDGGGTIRPRNLAKALVRRGHSLSVIYTPSRPKPGFPPYYIEEREDDGIHLFAIYNRHASFMDPLHPECEIHDQEMVGVVEGLIERLRPDLIHIHSLLGFSLESLRVFRDLHLPAIYTSRNYWPICPILYLFREDLRTCPGPSDDGEKCALCLKARQNAPLYAKRLSTARECLRDNIGLHLAISFRAREIFIQNGFSDDNIKVLHQQPETVDLIWEEVGSKREHRAPSGRRIRVGFIGYVLPMKGVHVLLDALNLLGQEHVEGHVFGKGTEYYLDALRRHDTKGILHFHGEYMPDDLPRILSSIDILVVPSLWEETQGVVVAEGLSGRVPVIGSRIGGIPEFIEEGVNGFLFQPGDPVELAQKIEIFLRDHVLLSRMGRGITPPKGFQRYVDELLQHYNEVTNMKGITGNAPWSRKSFQGGGLCIRWEGPFSGSGSLALINRELCMRIVRDGNEVSIIPRGESCGEDSRERWMGDLASLIGAPLSRRPDVVIRHMWPPDLSPPEDGLWVMIQPWELASIPRKWIDPLRGMVDEIWTPSVHSRDSFIRAGIPQEKVVVIPNGVDVEIFHPNAAPMMLSTEKGFRFLFVGGTIRRKGVDVLLEAYCRAFKRDDDVCLVIKDQGVGGLYPGQNEVALIKGYMTGESYPEILYIDNELSPQEMASLYATCDCLVHPFRAEGFGLPIIEAMACGLPVVVSRWVPALEFLNDQVAYFVGGREVTGTQKEYGGMELCAPVVFFEPDPWSLADMMRKVFEDRTHAVSKGQRGRRLVEENLTWEHMYLRASDRLRALMERPPLRVSRAQRPPLSEGKRQIQLQDLTPGANLRVLERPDDASIRTALLRGEELVGLGLIDEARELFLTVIENCPECAEAYNNLAFINWQEGDKYGALSSILCALERAPQDPDILWNCCEILEGLGRKEDARAIRSQFQSKDWQERNI